MSHRTFPINALSFMLLHVIVQASSISSQQLPPTLDGHDTPYGGTRTVLETRQVDAFVPPPGCTTVAQTIYLPEFGWFNSSHNLDCASSTPNYPSDAVWCFNTTSGGAPGTANFGPYVHCDGPAADPVGSQPGPGECWGCYSLCPGTPWWQYFPGETYQPPGFGPADVLNLTGCDTSNPHDYYSDLRLASEIGAGPVDCGIGNYGSVDLQFVGNSNLDESVATLSFAERYTLYNSTDDTSCVGWAIYNASFPLYCTRDEGGNATCTTDLPLPVTLVNFTDSPY